MESLKQLLKKKNELKDIIIGIVTLAHFALLWLVFYSILTFLQQPDAFRASLIITLIYIPYGFTPLHNILKDKLDRRLR